MHLSGRIIVFCKMLHLLESFLMDGYDLKLWLYLFVYDKDHLQIGSLKAPEKAAPN